MQETMDNAQVSLGKEPVMSHEDAVNLLNKLGGEDIARLRRMSKMFKAPHAGRHNEARALRAKARILKRKGKWKSLKPHQKATETT